MRNFRSWSLGLFVVALWAATASAQGQPQSSQSLWEDFIHYARIRSLDLAAGSGQALVKATTPSQLLDVVEASIYKDDYESTLAMAAKIPQIKDVAEQISQRLQEARIARARDKDRILADIENLTKGERAALNAIPRLRAAGQFAAPFLLAALLDDKQADKHPYVLSAMVSIGQPMIYPLAVALPKLEARPMGQVAQVLAEIGYRRALPYLKLALSSPSLNPDSRLRLQSAYDQIARSTSLPSDADAAGLFLGMGQGLYATETRNVADLPGYDAATKGGVGIVWYYTPANGLIYQEVPGPIFGDVLAMMAAQQALMLQPNLDPALSLWLLGNLRREIRLPAGQTDPSYGKDMQPAGFYLMMAGPLRQNDVLERSLRDNDTALALKAVQALASTANRRRAMQPLVRALYFPDRRVRFAAAFAMANARPESEFAGSFRVVPVLCEALRQTVSRSVLIVAPDMAVRNKLAGIFSGKELGYQVMSSPTLADAAEQLKGGAGVDLIVVAHDSHGVGALFHDAAGDNRLASVPVLAVVSDADQADIKGHFAGESRAPATITSTEVPALKAAADQAAKASIGKAMGEDEATAAALTALRLLHEIALSSGKIFNIADAQPTLIAALGDKNAEVVRQAGGVLALLGDAAAQKAIADAALDKARTDDLRVALLGNLAESASYFGNMLDATESDGILALVQQAKGPLAIAASRAHGALTLPTSDAVKLIAAGSPQK